MSTVAEVQLYPFGGVLPSILEGLAGPGWGPREREPLWSVLKEKTLVSIPEAHKVQRLREQTYYRLRGKESRNKPLEFPLF